MVKYDSVGVLGGGSWGTTLAHLLGLNGQNVLLWLRDEKSCQELNDRHLNKKYTNETLISERVTATTSLEEVALRCEIITLAIPSHAFRKVAYELGNYLQADQILLSACKGLESKTYARMSSVLEEETCCQKIGALAGPNLYKEILSGHPSATVVASSFHEVIWKSIEVYSSKNFRVYGNDDLAGVELGGAIKNVIAIAAGIMDGLNYGSNVKALLLTRGITEMSRIGIQIGANPLTFTGLTGVGDTMVTCTSPLSRNYQVGYCLAKGETLESILENVVTIAEGVNTAKVLHDFAQSKGLEIPIIEGVYQVLYEKRDVMDVIFESMQRKASWEIDPTFTADA